jgi:hypothetical protein
MSALLVALIAGSLQVSLESQAPYLMGKVAVQWEIGLSAAQRRQLQPASSNGRTAWPDYTKAFRSLTTAQRARFQQIAWQSADHTSLLDPLLQARIGLSAAQRNKLRELMKQGMARWHVQSDSGGTVSGNDPRMIGRYRAGVESERRWIESYRAMRAVLTPTQAQQWRAALGEPFDVSGALGYRRISARSVSVSVLDSGIQEALGFTMKASREMGERYKASMKAGRHERMAFAEEELHRLPIRLQKRFQELELQLVGASAIICPVIWHSLGFSQEQAEDLYLKALSVEADYQARIIKAQPKRSSPSMPPDYSKMNAAERTKWRAEMDAWAKRLATFSKIEKGLREQQKAAIDKLCLTSLSQAQRSKWQAMLGRPVPSLRQMVGRSNY